MYTNVEEQIAQTIRRSLTFALPRQPSVVAGVVDLLTAPLLPHLDFLFSQPFRVQCIRQLLPEASPVGESEFRPQLDGPLNELGMLLREGQGDLPLVLGNA
ncbi:hypothetical protein MTO96_045857, partial [Rhipicephalus appendiculatus]